MFNGVEIDGRIALWNIIKSHHVVRIIGEDGSIDVLWSKRHCIGYFCDISIKYTNIYCVFGNRSSSMNIVL